MNNESISFEHDLFFLNGVCRHERYAQGTGGTITFLNGVCRHEQAREQVLNDF